MADDYQEGCRSGKEDQVPGDEVVPTILERGKTISTIFYTLCNEFFNTHQTRLVQIDNLHDRFHEFFDSGKLRYQ